VEQHRARHWADAAWDGGDPGRLRLDLIEADIPDEPSFFFAMDADVDDDRALPDVLGPDHLPPAGSYDEEISPPSDFWKVLSARVADRDGGVLAQEQLCERLANEVRAPDDDGLAP